MLENRTSRAAKVRRIGFVALVAFLLGAGISFAVLARHWPFSQERIAQAWGHTAPGRPNTPSVAWTKSVPENPK